MTVSTTKNKISYVGNGMATEYAVPFPYLETSHLTVYQLLNDIQTERNDWTIQSGNLVFSSAPVSGSQIVIMRKVPMTQDTNYQDNELLSADTLERCFDKLTMQVQQLAEKSDRAVTVDVFDDTQAAELLPSIRTAVSTAAGYATVATTQATNATTSALTASEQAAIATAKAVEVATALTSKANLNFDNVTNDGKKNASGWGMPSNTVILDIFPATLTTNPVGYIAPANGYIKVTSLSEGGLDLYSANTNLAVTVGGGSGCMRCSYIPVRKSQEVFLKSTVGTSTAIDRVFVYAQGEI